MLSLLFGGGYAEHEIYFSRDIQQGQLLRWMIVVKCVRYMLLRRPDGYYALERDEIWDWTPEKEALQARQGRVMVDFYQDRHLIAPIAYTSLSRRKVLDRVHVVLQRFPAYFSWTHCQEFLRQFVNSMFERPALQWQWFVDNTDVARHETRLLPRTPDFMIPSFIAQQQQEQQEQHNQNHRSAIPEHLTRMLNGYNWNISQQNQLANR